jgi:hypothetical protein
MPRLSGKDRSVSSAILACVNLCAELTQEEIDALSAYDLGEVLALLRALGAVCGTRGAAMIPVILRGRGV